MLSHDDPYSAEEVRLTLTKLQRDYPIDLEDAMVAVRDEKSKIKLNQMHDLTATGAASPDLRPPEDEHRPGPLHGHG